VKRLAIVGMPNTGKSTFFNRLTGSSSRVGNWPGVTVDLLSAHIVLGGTAVEVVDLPGIYDLHGFSEDEQIVRDFLENNTVDRTPPSSTTSYRWRCNSANWVSDRTS
jgi:ferrous iron transport protein B